MSTPNPEETQRQSVSMDSDREAPRSHIGTVLWSLAVVALVAFAIWWYSKDAEVRGMQSPDAMEEPLPAVDGADAVATPEKIKAPVVNPSGTPVDVPDRPKAAPKPVVTVKRDRGPVPLASNRQPEYPARALRSGVEGSVSVLIQINARGVPTDVRVVSRRGERSRDLDRAVMNAARDWRFDPAIRDGRPVAGEVILPVAFQRN